MSARADGYTIGALTYDSIVTVPYQNMLPTYSMDKLKLIARITSEPDAIIVDASSDYQTLQDLVDAAKADPGQIRVAVQNLGGRVHLTLLQLQKLTGAEFKIVSYPGGAAPQKEAILSDEVDVALTSLGDFSNLIDDGTVRGIVEFSTAKNPTYDVPTSEEAGIDLPERQLHRDRSPRRYTRRGHFDDRGRLQGSLRQRRVPELGLHDRRDAQLAWQ